jgi:hypothetical protein
VAAASVGCVLGLSRVGPPLKSKWSRRSAASVCRDDRRVFLASARTDCTRRALDRPRRNRHIA